MTPVEVIRVQDHALPLVRVPVTADPATLDAMLQQAGIPIGRPVVVLVGGADGLTAGEADACESTFVSSLVPVLEQLSAVLVDGGTDSGVMRLAGRARRQVGARSPHVGVVAVGTVRWPGDHRAAAERARHGQRRGDLDPDHTHVVAVPGDRWGDEGPWIAVVAGAVSGAASSVTVLANGGDIAYEDVRRSLDNGRPVLVLGWTGRAAEQIAIAVKGGPADPRAVALAGSPLVMLADDPGTFRSTLVSLLNGSDRISSIPSRHHVTE